MCRGVPFCYRLFSLNNSYTCQTLQKKVQLSFRIRIRSRIRTRVSGRAPVCYERPATNKPP